jgi:hypothetical protein
MVIPKRNKKVLKVDVLLKTTDLSTTKLEFLNSSAEIKGNYLLIRTFEEVSSTTKIFNLNEITAFKEYYNITNKNKTKQHDS